MNASGAARMSEDAATIDPFVQLNRKFDGEDRTRYVRDHKAEMLQCRISEVLQVLSFNRMAMNGLQGNIHALRQQHPTWPTFEEALKNAYAIEDTSKVLKIGWKSQTKVLRCSRSSYRLQELVLYQRPGHSCAGQGGYVS